MTTTKSGAKGPARGARRLGGCAAGLAIGVRRAATLAMDVGPDRASHSPSLQHRPAAATRVRASCAGHAGGIGALGNRRAVRRPVRRRGPIRRSSTWRCDLPRAFWPPPGYRFATEPGSTDAEHSSTLRNRVRRRTRCARRQRLFEASQRIDLKANLVSSSRAPWPLPADQSSDPRAGQQFNTLHASFPGSCRREVHRGEAEALAASGGGRSVISSRRTGVSRAARAALPADAPIGRWGRAAGLHLALAASTNGAIEEVLRRSSR